MQELPDRLRQKLADRLESNALRTLRHYPDLTDFSSNDYLGFSRHPEIQRAVHDYLHEKGEVGSGGSRLLTGNHQVIAQAEDLIAAFHKAESALFFGSGFEANSGLIASVCNRHDTILYDKLCHASIREGIRLSGAHAMSYEHNDPEDLQKKLEQAEGPVWVISESVFSMDGDICPLKEIHQVSEQYGARLIIDEAHATGVIGRQGEGLVQSLRLEDQVFARVHTFGKAIGVQGAAVLGSRELIDYLINFCRPFVYTTAPSPLTAVAVKASYSLLADDCPEFRELQSLMRYADQFQDVLLGQGTAIRQVMVPGNDRVKWVAEQVRKAGYLVLPVLSPTVASGKERIRVCLHAFNSKEQLKDLIAVLRENLQA